MLYDRHPQFPYHAVVPWPYFEMQGGGYQQDWVESFTLVESWLETCVGPHWVRWGWDMFKLDSSQLCGVRFARSTDSVLFLLRWG